MKKNKLLLIGWDAADWKIIGPMLSKGELPALQRLIKNGVYGNMSTMNPAFSPMLWTSVATGKTPDKHGILGFIEIAPDLKGVRPVTTNSRKTRAIWNILHNQGFKSNLVGWWPSFPAEPINGVVVSEKFQKIQKDPKKKNPIHPQSIHPREFTSQIRDLRLRPYEVTDQHILPFIPKANEVDQEKDQSLSTFSKLFAENVSVHAASTYVMRNTEWDFMSIYYDLIDHMCHAFMKYHPPKLKEVPTKYYELYKDVVKGAYKFQDMMLERTLNLIDDDTTVMVVSDHGFEAGANRILQMPKYPAAPALEHRQFGIFVAAGPNINKNKKIFGLGLIDVAPTILHHFDLPVGKDMDGKVALDIFKTSKEVKYIDSWDKVAGDFGELEKDLDDDQLTDNETMEQLIELGYIEKPEEKIEDAILKTKCDLRHNLARVYYGKKDYQSAKEILLDLLKEKEPIDPIPYYMDLLAIELKYSNFDKAEEYLNKLKELDEIFKRTSYFAESQIALGKGNFEKSLKILYDVIKVKSTPEIWFQIGKVHRRISEYDKAKTAFENAIEQETDRAKYHNALAEVLLRLGEYEEAAETALTAIELVKYFPSAHYTLGEALEKLGDLENAKIAYETAASLKPKDFHRAEKALENVNEKIQEDLNLQDKTAYKYRDNQIVLVSGLPRSGTSLMMQMLNKGGIEPLTDDKRKPDDSNPKGYYEFEPVMSLHRDNSWLGKAQNKAVKIVAPLLKHLSPEYRYKIIFMNRDLNEIVKSQQKMIGKDPETIPVTLYNSYHQQLQQIEVWKEREPHVELIYVNFKEVLENPVETSNKIEKFIGVPLEKNAMANCVDLNLYRNKSISSKES